MPTDGPIERLSPQEAVDQAAWVVSGPVLILMLGPPGAVLFVGLFAGAGLRGLAPIVGMVLIASWLFAWLAWSILVPRWRLWAYERVEDIDALKRLAIANRVLWPDGHIIHRSEIAPPALRARLIEIELERRAAAEAAAAAAIAAKPKPRARSKASSVKSPAS